MRTRDERRLRAAAAASTCSALAVTAHLAGGGPAPTPSMLLLALVGPAVLGTAMSGRTWSRGRLLAALAAGQAVAHVLLSFGASMPAAPCADQRMLGCHVLGTALTMWALTRADAVLAWCVAEACALWVAVRLRSYLPRPRTSGIMTALPSAVLHGLTPASSAGVRGPPLRG